MQGEQRADDDEDWRAPRAAVLAEQEAEQHAERRGDRPLALLQPQELEQALKDEGAQGSDKQHVQKQQTAAAKPQQAGGAAAGGRQQPPQVAAKQQAPAGKQPAQQQAQPQAASSKGAEQQQQLSQQQQMSPQQQAQQQQAGSQQAKQAPQLKCAVFNNVSTHLDVSAGLAWALQVRGRPPALGRAAAYRQRPAAATAAHR